MNVLILDHHFQQDIESLLVANRGRDTIRTIDPEYFARAARQYFPRSVFGPQLAEYHRPDLQPQREGYKRAAWQLLFDLYRVFPFDLFVAPSDTFFYIRDVIDACHELGVPFVVVQKELGVSTKALEQHAAIMKRWFPFAGDWMTTCSEKSRSFWVAAGARPEQVSVVGQPRFDWYASPEQWGALDRLGLSSQPGQQVVLFLSYDLDAYDEERALGGHHHPWAQLHQETEAALVELAKTQRYLILVKPHPQHDAAALAAMSKRMEGVPHLRILPGDLDTRLLIVRADTVIGFQTTAMAEAMAAGKKVIYTFWTEPALKVQHSLLPFHELGACIDVARSPAELREAVVHDRPLSAAALAARRAFFEDFLGPIDGRASARVWRILEERVAAAMPVPAEIEARRARLHAQSAAYCRRETRRAWRRWLFRRAATAGVTLLGLPAANPVRRRLQLRCDWEQARMDECREALAGRWGPTRALVGSRRENLLGASCRFLGRRLARRGARP